MAESRWPLARGGKPMAESREPTAVIEPEQTRQAQELKHSSPLVGCRFDPSGAFVFAGAQDSTVQRWTLADGKRTELAGHQSWVRGMAFAPKNNLLFTGDYHGKVIAWTIDAEKPEPLRTIEAHRGWVRALAVSPDDRRWPAAATITRSSSGPSPTANPCASSPGTRATSTTWRSIPAGSSWSPPIRRASSSSGT